MIDLRGIARRLRLSVDQLRLAADLLQQGYQPGFIERYRADETGRLPRSVLWSLKLELDRQTRLDSVREKVKQQLPKDAELDDEASEFLQRATTEVEVEAALRCFRARRNLSQSQDQSGPAGQLLEKLIAHSGEPIPDLTAWAASELSSSTEEAQKVVEQIEKLVGSILQCDTGLSEKLRRGIQRKAQLTVTLIDPDKKPAESAPAESTSDESSSAESQVDEVPAAESDKVEQGEAEAVEGGVESSAATPATESLQATEATAESSEETAAKAEQDTDNPSESPDTAADAATDETPAISPPGPSEGEQAEATNETGPEAAKVSSSEKEVKAKSDAKSSKTGESGKDSKKAQAKLTPRQRRRRWLVAMLQPMKSLKKPVSKLTAYQQLMLGRGRRSQLVNTPLQYDRQQVAAQARDAFVAEGHPQAKWFDSVVTRFLDEVWLAKLETDALADLEELAQEKLLENAADQLRQNLLRRPVRGHVVMVVDTVGPKTASVAVIAHDGKVLATDEVTCSAHPDAINQNVVRLGELAHRYKVTLLCLTNGPARRFLVLTVKELINQSGESGLRWTMADRGGAEAYAAGRVALRELSAHNRRDRAAIWIGRSIQDPLSELLKVDVNRLRLGSYQRELPQEPLKKLVRETIADCVCLRGVDVHHASVDELQYVHGVAEEQAQQIATVSAQGQVSSREALLNAVANWPEQEARQAAGTLRVFESEEVLDATAIHPEDYRLAQRLIDNTDLEAPSAAPENWSKPAPEADLTEAKSSEEKPAAESGATETESEASEGAVTEADASESAEESSSQGDSSADAPAAEAAPTEAPAAEPTATSEVDSLGTAEAVDSETSQEQTATDVPDEVSSEASDESAQEGSAATSDSDSSESKASDTVAAEASAEGSADVATAALPAVKPEYPEDAEAAAAKPLAIDVEKLARGWQVGREKLRWIATCLSDPFADSRLDGTIVPMLSEMPTLATLKPGTCVWAVVVGVADFGAFVELAPDCSGLIHISRLSSNYVEDPHQVVQVGDLILAWVISVDEKKNRVALTALSPAEREAAENQREADRRERGRDRGSQGRGQRGGSRDNRGRSQQGGGGRSEDSGQRSGGGRSGPPRRGRGGKPHDGGRDRRGGPRKSSKPIVVKSKKPVAPISSAMKEGDEPLRSFSDLMQFYEAKRTDVPPPKATDKPAAAKAPSNEAAPKASSSTESAATEGSTDGVAPVADQSAPDQQPSAGAGAQDSNPGSDKVTPANLSSSPANSETAPETSEQSAPDKSE